MTSSVNKRSSAGVVGVAMARALRAAAGGRCAAAGIWVIWMRGRQVVSCESVPRLDAAVPGNRPTGVNTAVVVAVAPSRLSEPVIGRARVLVDYLDGQGIDVHAAHARALQEGALWTSLQGPAVGGIIGQTSPGPVLPRRHRWLPGFGNCTHSRLVTAALTPLAAVALAVPVAHAGPAGQPGVISEPEPGQAGIIGPIAPETTGSPNAAGAEYPDHAETPVRPAPERQPEAISPAPEPIPGSRPAPESRTAPEPPMAPEPNMIPELYVEPEAQASEPQANAVPEVETVVEPSTYPTPAIEAVEMAPVAPDPAPVEADSPPTYSYGAGQAVEPLPVVEDPLQFGGISVPQPEWMTPEAAEWAQGWHEFVVTEAADALAEVGIADPAVDTVLGVDTEPVPLSEAVAPIVEVIPEPIVHDVEAAISQPVADLAAVVEPPLAQVVNEVLPHWQPALD